MTDYREPMAPTGADDPEAERIVSEIEITRTEMSATIDEIGDRLQPQNIANEAREKIREATVGRVERIVDDAGQTAQRTSNTLVETVRQNPVPAALAAIGFGWLALKMREQRPASYGNGWRATADDYGYSPRYTSGYSGRFQPARQDPADRARELADQAAGRLQEVGTNVQRTAQTAVEGTQEKVEQAKWQAQSAVQDAQWQFDRTFNENPLALGALAIGVGAAVALAVPSTMKERELMGEPRDRLMAQAGAVASDVLDEAKNKAQEVAQQVQPSTGEQPYQAG